MLTYIVAGQFVASGGGVAWNEVRRDDNTFVFQVCFLVKAFEE